MYIDGMVSAVPRENKEAYRKHLQEILPLFLEVGMLRMVEAWQDDVPKGKVTDFFQAVQAKDNEAIVFSWFEWPSKEVRDAGMKKMMSDERMAEIQMPFDGQRTIFGGFERIWDKSF